MFLVLHSKIDKGKLQFLGNHKIFQVKYKENKHYKSNTSILIKIL